MFFTYTEPSLVFRDIFHKENPVIRDLLLKSCSLAAANSLPVHFLTSSRLIVTSSSRQESPSFKPAPYSVKNEFYRDIADSLDSYHVFATSWKNFHAAITFFVGRFRESGQLVLAIFTTSCPDLSRTKGAECKIAHPIV